MKDKDGNMKDRLAQSEAGKPVFKELFGDLSVEKKGFKYQITMKALLRKRKENDDIEFTLILFTLFTLFILILLLKQSLMSINMVLIDLFKKFWIE